MVKGCLSPECRVGESMIQGRKVVVAALVALAMRAPLYADMVPQSVGGPSSAWMLDCCGGSNPTCVDGLDLCVEFGPAQVDLLPLAYLAGLPVEMESADSAGPAVRILSHNQSSLDFCLYALVGLGLCRSGRWVRKASLGFVPDWYHSGGPFQIGHSHALNPDTLYPVPVCCFIQPDGTPDHSLSLCRTDAIASVQHPSQHAPASPISRGPPLCS